MSDHKTRETASQPFWRRWRWPGASASARREGLSGIDAARLDVGYEAAYTPNAKPGSESPSGPDGERPLT